MRPEAQAAYNVEIDRMTDGTVWVSGGCESWYIDANGHNSTLWPTFTWPFRRRLREFDEAAYALGAAVPEPLPASFSGFSSRGGPSSSIVRTVPG